MRVFHTSACCGLIVLAAVACTQTTTGTPAAGPNLGPSRTAPATETDGSTAPGSGTPATPDDGPPDGLLPGEISALLLSDDDAGNVIGIPMPRLGSWQQPPAAITLPDRNDCKHVAITDEDEWTSDFTAYRSAKWVDDPDAIDFLILQMAATYPNHTAATRTFQQSFNADLARRCASATVPTLDAAEDTQWRVDSLTVSDTAATFTVSQLDDGHAYGWRCSGEVRVKRNVMTHVTACQFGNPATVARQVSDLTADRIGH